MFYHSGYVTKKDFHDVQNNPLFKKLENENDSFKTTYLHHLGEYGQRWTTDSFHQWSRVWEYPYIYAMIENKVKNNEQMKVLDAGCGLSFFPFLVKRDFPTIEMHGTDMDPLLVQTYANINKEIKSNVLFKLGDLRNLDYPEKSFDIIYCISVLEHTENYKAIVDHFHRLLKPGGQLILTFDISLDGDRTIPIEEGQKLLDYIISKFRPVYEASGIKVGLANKDDILSTSYVAKINKKLLPWRSPWKNALKNLLAFKKPRFVFDLACYCQVFEKE